MAATVALIADSLSAFAPVRVWECLRCRKRWAVDMATCCPYCRPQHEKRLEDIDPYDADYP
jgi:hypothetical protein